jgi:hypothetical protein
MLLHLFLSLTTVSVFSTYSSTLPSSSSLLSSVNISYPTPLLPFSLSTQQLTSPNLSTRYRSKGALHHKAQFKEDIYLYEHYFYGKTHGIILESGALDGLLFSNTWMFETEFSWQVIHIEGTVTNSLSLSLSLSISLSL